MGRTSGRRAARLFCEAIVCGKMTAFWEAEQHEDLTLYAFIFWTISSVFSRRCPPNKHHTTTANRNGVDMGLVIVANDLLHVIRAGLFYSLQ